MDVFCLFVLMFFFPVNNFSVMSRHFPVFFSWARAKQRKKSLSQWLNAVPPDQHCLQEYIQVQQDKTLTFVAPLSGSSWPAKRNNEWKSQDSWRHITSSPNMAKMVDNELTLYLLVSSADNLCKQFGPRSGLTTCRAWYGSKLFDTLMIFLQEFFLHLPPSVVCW